MKFFFTYWCLFRLSRSWCKREETKIKRNTYFWKLIYTTCHRKFCPNYEWLQRQQAFVRATGQIKQLSVLNWFFFPDQGHCPEPGGEPDATRPGAVFPYYVGDRVHYACIGGEHQTRICEWDGWCSGTISPCCGVKLHIVWVQVRMKTVHLLILLV